MRFYHSLKIIIPGVSLLLSACHRDKPARNTFFVDGVEWSTYNLDGVVYANGDSIPYIEDTLLWKSTKEGAWCYYENQRVDEYGKLYNGYAITDSRGLCPQGWHVATKEEWNALVRKFGGDSAAAHALKKTMYWKGVDMSGQNKSGFSALPAGNRTIYGTFNGRTNSGVFWTGSEADSGKVWTRYINRLHNRVGEKAGDKTNGLSCRCVKDRPNSRQNPN